MCFIVDEAGVSGDETQLAVGSVFRTAIDNTMEQGVRDAPLLGADLDRHRLVVEPYDPAAALLLMPPDSPAARAAGCGDFIKIEVITDMQYLMPDNWETLKATEILAKEGFVVLPYVLPDLPLAKRLEDAGAAAVMPLGAPIGSNRGLETRPLIEMLIGNCRIPGVVDAGIGRPSQAAAAMEMGADAVLVNTAIATARDPEAMGRAFDLAVRAGRAAYLAELAEQSVTARASSPLTGFLDD